MAGVSSRELRNRIRSMESTRQLTKAMEMVASSRLRRAQARLQNSRPYFEILRSTITSIVEANRDFSSPYLTHRGSNKTACIVIAGDRGLAGGYNSNVLRLALYETEGKEAAVIPIGRKAVDFFHGRDIPIFTETLADAENMSVGGCFTLSAQLCKAYLSGEFDEVHIAYTGFTSILTQTPAALQLLPLLRHSAAPASDILYEPNSIEVFDAIIPEYVGGMVYGALCESRAAEQAARRAAMDSATRNAGEMIDELKLKFNRARQAAITQEISEIVAGA